MALKIWGKSNQRTAWGLLPCLILVLAWICPVLGAEARVSSARVTVLSPGGHAQGPVPIILCSETYTPYPQDQNTPSQEAPLAEPLDKGDTGTESPDQKTQAFDPAGKARQDPTQSGTSPEVPAQGTAFQGQVLWAGDDCGCTPIQPGKVQGKGIITYGFFHRGLELEEDKEKNAAIAKIKFSRLNRIGYQSLIYDPVRGFINYEAWENNPYIRVARQYNTRVDIVVTFTDKVGELFASKDKTRVLAGGIERLIRNHGGSGVTIDLRNTASLDFDVMDSFLKVLRDKVKGIAGHLFVNLLTGFDPEAKGAGPFNTFTLREIADLTLTVDLYLVMLASENKDADQLKADFLDLSERLDRYGLENNNIEFKDKTLPILPYLEDADQEIFTQILTVGYGGVGLWPDKSLGDTETRFISTVLKDHPALKDMDFIKAVLEKFCPNCCKFICPLRIYLLVPAYLLGIGLLAYLMAAYFFCDLRTFAAAHARYFVSAVGALVAMVLGIILCVPFWQGMRSLAIVLVVVCCLGYMAGEFFRRRRQARFP